MIYETNDSFEFNKLKLNPPMVVSGGNYFIKYQINGSNLYIQPPECKLRGQISKNSKRPFCDLLFSQENFSFIKWMEDLETHTCKLIHEKREEWFDSEMDLEHVVLFLRKVQHWDASPSLNIHCIRAPNAPQITHEPMRYRAY